MLATSIQLRACTLFHPGDVCANGPAPPGIAATGLPIVLLVDAVTARRSSVFIDKL